MEDGEGDDSGDNLNPEALLPPPSYEAVSAMDLPGYSEEDPFCLPDYETALKMELQSLSMSVDRAQQRQVADEGVNSEADPDVDSSYTNELGSNQTVLELREYLQELVYRLNKF